MSKLPFTSIHWPNAPVIDVCEWRNAQVSVRRRAMERNRRAVRLSNLNVGSFVWRVLVVSPIGNHWTSLNNAHVRMRSASSSSMSPNSGHLYIECRKCIEANLMRKSCFVLFLLFFSFLFSFRVVFFLFLSHSVRHLCSCACFPSIFSFVFNQFLLCLTLLFFLVEPVFASFSLELSFSSSTC